MRFVTTLCDLTFRFYGYERGVKRGGRVRPQVDGTHYSTDVERMTFHGLFQTYNIL